MSENHLQQTGLNDQLSYIQLVSSIMAVKARGAVPMAFVKTYGCQQNVSDSEKIKGMLAQMGYSFTECEEEADFILFNTCAVREHAEDRVFGNVGALKNLKNKNPSLLIALCGCMMEQEHVAEKIKKSYPFVGLVFGTHSLYHFPQLLYQAISGAKRVFERGIDDKQVVEGLPARRDGSFKAWLPVMYGCDNFCSYCVVPYVRGRERSRTSAAVLQEARELVASGYKDITLLGQNVNSYGKKLEEDINFARLLEQMNAIDGEYWIRFMTSHPKDCTHELIDVMAQSKHVCKHLHLPFQSGSNRVLKAMNRGYTREKYLETVAYAKSKMPGLSLTSDVIVGFPGETYEEFKETLSLIKEVGFTSLYTFIFSPRVGTPAAKMDDPVPAGEKSAWFSELLKVQEEIAAERCASMVGDTVRVLVEEETGKNGELAARTEGNIVVEFAAPPSLIGSFADVKITRARNWILKGELVTAVSQESMN